MSYHPVTRCTYCGIESANQPAGDGCHACSRGVMILAPEAIGFDIIGESYPLVEGYSKLPQ